VPATRADLGTPPSPAGPALPGAAGEEPVSIRCFGGFHMEISGRPVDITTVRARARSALRLLATHAGQVVHKEVLIEALWPGLAVTAATRNLQVTVSALRGLLEPTSERGKSQLLIRSGEAYGIALPAGSVCDTVTFVTAVNRWKQTHNTGDVDATITAMRAALAAYPAPLLPEEGPADWAVEARERFHRQATGVARALAAAELDRGNIAEAVTTAEYCLSLDQHDDEAWQVLIRAYTASGALAKAAEVRQRYTAMLTSLGLGHDVDLPGNNRLARA
jgi:DNA-binding SARP family transcriptional activator